MGNEENTFYEELCQEYKTLLSKQKHSFSDVQKFNEICKAKKNLEMMGQYSEERYTNSSYMNHGLNSPELSYGNMSHGSYDMSRQGGSYANGGMSREQGYSDRMSRNGSYMSNHSIIDRLINATEGLMDQAGSDFERKVLKTWANRMRTEGYGD